MAEKLKTLEALLGAYMISNPAAENPMQYMEIFGITGLIDLLKKADGREIEFIMDETITDGVIPKIDGKTIE